MNIQKAKICLERAGFKVIKPADSEFVLIVPPDGRVEFNQKGEWKSIDPSNHGIAKTLRECASS